MKYIYITQNQKWKNFDGLKLKSIKLSNSHYLVYLGKDEEGNEIFVFYFKKLNNYLIKIFKNIIQEILNDEDTLFVIY